MALGLGLFGYNKMAKSAACEVNAGPESELVDGIGKKVQVGDNEQNFIVVVKSGDKVYAVSGKCPHYGLPLTSGFVDGTSITCPFHQAAFDITSGEQLNPPALDSLKSFPVRIENGEVIVSISEEDIDSVAAKRHSSQMVKPDGSDARTFVIVGGGAAGNSCAETLRRDGFRGRIVIIAKEDFLPYDRVVLSKNIQADATKLSLRGQDFYDEYGIEIIKGSSATGVDQATKTVHTTSGEVKYDKLCFATGAAALIPGPYKSAVANLENVFSIRNAADQIAAKPHLIGASDIVIIGGSFLGLEAATTIKKNFPEKNVTVIEFQAHPLRRIFGADIAS
jgi:NADPH-dependent 2,4-dienoyl-CoA reductase/sulfur reductase-like enzyme/nitrite reductase/ring-hydroxylating ferredoxin subunit